MYKGNQGIFMKTNAELQWMCMVAHRYHADIYT